MSSSRESARWYVIYTHLKQEDRVSMNLEVCGVPTFNPKIREPRSLSYSSKITYLVKPLFPRYIFARVEAARLHQLRFTRGVCKVVCFGDYFIPVDEEIISEVKSQIGIDGYIATVDELAPADRVVIRNGPMANFRGIFIGSTRADDRVRILLDTVTYQAHLEIEREQVKKMTQ